MMFDLPNPHPFPEYEQGAIFLSDANGFGTNPSGPSRNGRMPVEGNGDLLPTEDLTGTKGRGQVEIWDIKS
jgi:hypothetical protein